MMTHPSRVLALTTLALVLVPVAATCSCANDAWRDDGPNALTVVVENTDGAGGLFGSVEVRTHAGTVGALNGTPVRGWKLRGSVSGGARWARFGAATGRPAFYRTRFTLPAGAAPGTVYRVQPGGLTRGMAWLNGHNIGRYPDRLVPDGLYLPECWLLKGRNTLEVFNESGGDPGPARILIEEGAGRVSVLYKEVARETPGTPAAREAKMIIPGEPWKDTDGKPIQAHGGGVLARDGVNYWYGEDKSNGAGNAVGVRCYSSRDLLTWKDGGVVLPKDAVPEQFRERGVLERPKVLYNPATGKFVMWMHLDADRYRVAQAGVAIADRPQGLFTFLNAFRPVRTSTFRDMNLFQDDDGAAYVFYAGEGNATMHIVRLNREYTAPEQPMVEGKTWARTFIDKSREAPAPFKHGGRYYVITSGCTGWVPNAADIAVADSILGPWTSLGNPCSGPDAGTTFGAQSTFVMPVPGRPAGEFIFMADRWNPGSLADSRYVWLPFTVGDDRRVALEWCDRWDPSPFAI